MRNATNSVSFIQGSRGSGVHGLSEILFSALFESLANGFGDRSLSPSLQLFQFLRRISLQIPIRLPWGQRRQVHFRKEILEGEIGNGK